jgi:hypothetical protein
MKGKSKRYYGLGNWLDFKNYTPEPRTRVLVCYENGYVDIEDVQDEEHYRSLGYPVPNCFDGRVPTFKEMCESGNREKLVAWMPIPDWPTSLCREDADGEMP